MRISVVVPAWNCEQHVASFGTMIATQQEGDVEFLIVDDGSTDRTSDLLQAVAHGDPRVKLFARGNNEGPAAARNAALREAAGDWIAYSDIDDELYPDHFDCIRRHAEGDLLFFGYDFELVGDGNSVESWLPFGQSEEFFAANTSVPLGVAHRRELFERFGGFDETLWQAEDWDLWKRFVRNGVEAVFISEKSGKYRIYPDSRSRKPRMTHRQRILYSENRNKGRPLYETKSPALRSDPPRVLFGSPHCLVDPNSGAAAATLRWLTQLKAESCKVDGICLTQLDANEELCVEEIASDAKPIRKGDTSENANGGSLRWLGFNRCGVSVYAGRTKFTRRGAAHPNEIASFLEVFDRHLHEQRPDVFLTYGGDDITSAMIRLVKRRDIPIVFALHNFAYRDVNWFHPCDYVIVPSEFASRHYWHKLGLHTMVMPNIIYPEQVVSPIRAPKYVTFVNPQSTKGVYIFARIAEQIARRRPDIPMLVVESRGRAKDSLEATGLDLSFANNLFFMNSTTDPRQIYAVSKVVLMPSLWWESFGLVAAEAMANGIPVLASDRGALPEIVGDAGLLFNIPERYTPTSTDVPTADEVEPWVSAIERLWDDQSWYDDFAERGRKRAERWHPKVVGPKLYDFFAEAFPQPNPPFVPEPWPIET